MNQEPQPATGPAEDLQHPIDAVESVVPYIPLVVPAVGAAMIFLLAFIAVYMA
ncbi:hypothetical protein [Melaminivora alkalimesophila]|uniref:Uncharacterized protein n=1 Tax=Melaminivora alkalimesophila TaxID=1165852 RepID=A0A317RD15_9BURK|nr:hypothetical protein [Melaminivora alkalimesophila]PWW46983.1 hypothetical protein DFR36_103258 [Melaminivora alkalimesophila]